MKCLALSIACVLLPYLAAAEEAYDPDLYQQAGAPTSCSS